MRMDVGATQEHHHSRERFVCSLGRGEGNWRPRGYIGMRDRKDGSVGVGWGGCSRSMETTKGAHRATKQGGSTDSRTTPPVDQLINEACMSTSTQTSKRQHVTNSNLFKPL